MKASTLIISILLLYAYIIRFTVYVAKLYITILRFTKTAES